MLKSMPDRIYEKLNPYKQIQPTAYGRGVILRSVTTYDEIE
jgi:hypothetical protein